MGGAYKLEAPKLKSRHIRANNKIQYSFFYTLQLLICNQYTC